MGVDLKSLVPKIKHGELALDGEIYAIDRAKVRYKLTDDEAIKLSELLGDDICQIYSDLLLRNVLIDIFPSSVSQRKLTRHRKKYTESKFGMSEGFQHSCKTFEPFGIKLKPSRSSLFVVDIYATYQNIVDTQLREDRANLVMSLIRLSFELAPSQHKLMVEYRATDSVMRYLVTTDDVLSYAGEKLVADISKSNTFDCFTNPKINRKDAMEVIRNVMEYANASSI